MARFERYIVRSHPSVEGRDQVYLGDDTLFLMEGGRELLHRLQKEIEGPLCCLDLCCGGGGVGLALPDFDGELLGVDLNPVAIDLAQTVAESQGLSHRYRCFDINEGIPGRYHLVLGNPPTLSSEFTGRDVFYATGTVDMFCQTLESVLEVLHPKGRALFTFFSSRSGTDDPSWDRVGEVLRGRRGFRCRARREYPIDAGHVLRHNALELMPAGDLTEEFVPIEPGGVQLPALAWRR